ncbi:putative 3-demethylubiquinone-9 3-methyltransferase (glyoxalase superfamily) [Chitinophaga dinghuensis]|uniref:Putative 3-demethylubiquinone-9 3-methyltransferase (Glyoxalase superfamily) n=1 Tax=Chitinophaga dinghuensis TaxID=1539050 RepID=A0A327VST4_9BACT|nr:VOC family protein [Chitinophaga dinghuensis]RAJ79111.1 putative 3-demethylubiquinone-9 3-methyltransferase (glyoxalase superfamily) [Chitinophaga dinghuensis]
MQKIIPFLWFNNQAEEAINFYISVFKNARILSMNRYTSAGPGPEGSVMSAIFEIEGQTFYALNGGPAYTFNPAISLFVNCTTQEEIDELWDKLLADGGRPNQCGWLTDKFGLTWQIVPVQLGQLLEDKDRTKAARVMAAMMNMIKLDIKGLENAAAGQ